MWEEDQVLCQLLTPETLDIVYSIFNQPEKAKDELKVLPKYGSNLHLNLGNQSFTMLSYKN